MTVTHTTTSVRSLALGAFHYAADHTVCSHHADLEVGLGISSSPKAPIFTGLTGEPTPIPGPAQGITPWTPLVGQQAASRAHMVCRKRVLDAEPSNTPP